MKWILGAFSMTIALAALGLFSSTGQSQPPEKGPAARPARALTASGSGRVKFEADAAKIAFKIEGAADDLKSARAVLDKQSEKLKAALDGLKISLEIRTLPIEIQQQQNNPFGLGGGMLGGGFGFGGGGLGFAGAPPAFPIPAPAQPPAPAPPEEKKNADPADQFLAVPVPAPNKNAAAPAKPAEEPGKPAADGNGAAPAQPGQGQVGLQILQPWIVTIKCNEPAKLIEQVNKVLLTAAENGMQFGNANPNGQVVPASGAVVRFVKLDDKEFRRKALESAVADAVANAKVMARGADVKILDTLSISDPPTSRTGQPLPHSGNDGHAESASSELEITVKVTVVCSY